MIAVRFLFVLQSIILVTLALKHLPLKRINHPTSISTTLSATSHLMPPNTCKGFSENKMWDMKTFFSEHTMVFRQLPSILGAYVGPNAIQPKLAESVMLKVNGVNLCPYCTGLHGGLAKMLGSANLREWRGAWDSEAVLSHALTHARTDGRGPSVDESFARLVATSGIGRANSVRALCWFLQWGSMGGNTVDAFIGRRGNTNVPFLFRALVAIYYLPLFFIITVLNTMLKAINWIRFPGFIVSFIGIILTFVAGIWIVPIGLLGILLGN